MPYTFLYEIHNHLQLIPSTADDIVSHMQYGDNKESFLNFIFFLFFPYLVAIIFIGGLVIFA